MMTKTSDEYITNCDWLSSNINGDDLILCRVSALEFLELFSGYWNENKIEVYAKNEGKFTNVIYYVRDSFDNIKFIKEGNTLCTTINQTFNDMLAPSEQVDELALIEAMSNYFFSHNNSFDGLIILPENMEYFEYLKPLAIEYYNGE